MIDYNIDTITDTLYSNDAQGMGYTLSCVFDYISGKAYFCYLCVFISGRAYVPCVSLYQVELMFPVCLYIR